MKAQKVRSYMKMMASKHVNPDNGAVNMVTLAEEACQKFGGYDSSGGVPDSFFTLAYEVSEWHERVREALARGIASGKAAPFFLF